MGKWTGQRQAKASGISYRLGHMVGGRYFNPKNGEKKGDRRKLYSLDNPPSDVEKRGNIRSWKLE